eukprot:7079633-Prymnesium_polylepis.1
MCSAPPPARGSPSARRSFACACACAAAPPTRRTRAPPRRCARVPCTWPSVDARRAGQPRPPTRAPPHASGTGGRTSAASAAPRAPRPTGRSPSRGRASTCARTPSRSDASCEPPPPPCA